jgi:hypothetical protein
MINITDLPCLRSLLERAQTEAKGGAVDSAAEPATARTSQVLAYPAKQLVLKNNQYVAAN